MYDMLYCFVCFCVQAVAAVLESEAEKSLLGDLAFK